jgi:hypothetical protein
LLNAVVEVGPVKVVVAVGAWGLFGPNWAAGEFQVE